MNTWLIITHCLVKGLSPGLERETAVKETAFLRHLVCGRLSGCHATRRGVTLITETNQSNTLSELFTHCMLRQFASVLTMIGMWRLISHLLKQFCLNESGEQQLHLAEIPISKIDRVHVFPNLDSTLFIVTCITAFEVNTWSENLQIINEDFQKWRLFSWFQHDFVNTIFVRNKAG